MTADQWRRLAALEPSCLGCLNEDILDAERRRDEFEIFKGLRARIDETPTKHGREPLPQTSEEERAAAEEDGRLRTEQAVADLRQLKRQQGHLLGAVRKSRHQKSCPSCIPRRGSREQIAQLAARIAQNAARRAADDELYGPPEECD